MRTKFVPADVSHSYILGEVCPDAAEPQDGNPQEGTDFNVGASQARGVESVIARSGAPRYRPARPFGVLMCMSFSPRSAQMPRNQLAGDNLIADVEALSPFLKRLLASARDDDRRVAELCDAVLRRDWAAATAAAKILSRKSETSPSPALPSTPANSSAKRQNCA